jgi:Flp pilus assembly protein TadG
MIFHIASSRNRRAAVAPMAALLMTFLVGMLAFSIDIGYISAVQAELQNAADAAALAAVEQLQSPFVLFNAPGQTNQQTIYNWVTTNTTSSSSPICTAQQFAYYNQAGGVNVTVPSSDISFSFYDGTTFSSPSLANFPNTVNVITRRDNTANNPLGLFFGQVFGISTVSLTATASATMYNGIPGSPSSGTPGTSGYQAPIFGANLTANPPFTTSGTSSKITIDAHILPVALDINVWTNFANGNFVFTNGAFVSSTSAYLTSDNVSAASNNLPQLQVYPNNTNTPGSFGLIDVGLPSNNTPAFENWILDGTTPNDIAYLLKNSLLPVSPSAPQPWKVGPGMKSALLSSFEAVMGQANLIPLFQPSSPLPGYVAATGTGQNATYAVIGFASIMVTQATGSGSSMNISIQPASIVSPTLVIPYPLPAATFTQQSSFSGWVSGGTYSVTTDGSSGSSTTTVYSNTGGQASNFFAPAKLTR